MHSAIKKEWMMLLDPDNLRPALIKASILIACFEHLKTVIIGRLKSFYIPAGNSNADFENRYINDVLIRNKSEVYASFDWLKENQAINENDIQIFNNIKKYRNKLAHDLFSVVTKSLAPDEFEHHITELFSLLKKIEMWWIVTVDLPTDPDYDNRQVNEDDISPSSVIIMGTILNIALGKDDKMKYFYRDYFNSLMK